MSSLVLRPALIALAVLAASGASGEADSPAFDVILRHGTVLDGTGRPRFAADIGIRGRTIAAVGDLRAERAAVNLDVTGLFVAPGFINLHSHATAEGLKRAENMLTQGVTTEILNADGSGGLDLTTQLRDLAGLGLALNVGGNVGFNSVWAQVMGSSDARPSAEAFERMRAMVRGGLEQGAWGVSAGLDYKPGYYATAEEVERILSVARPFRTVFTNHDRLTPESGFSSRVGIAETIAIGEHAGLMPLVTHMKAQGMEQKTAPALLAMMDAAGERGVYTAADVYPYLAGQTGLAALIIPGWALDGGRDAMLQRFEDPGLRARIVEEAEKAMNARFGGPEGVYSIGQATRLVDAMKEMGLSSAGEALIRLLEKGDGGAILQFGIESDLVAILRHPTASVACDCGAVEGRAAHPRYYGTFPRVLGRYVREQNVMSLETAIRKMTGLPAATIGMVDRGLVAPGMAADLTVFDPATVVDRATFEAPTVRSVGILHVLVNGQIALRDGEVTDVRAGLPLFRAGHEPARSFHPETPRRVRVKGTSPRFSLSLDVSQGKGARFPHGSFRMSDEDAHLTVALEDPGAFHLTEDWATVIGPGRCGEKLGRVTVTVETKDPFASPPGSTLTVTCEDGRTLTRRLEGNPIRIEGNLDMMAGKEIRREP